VFGTNLPLKAAILGLGLLTAAHVQAQGTASGTGDEKAVRGSTAGPVNPTLDAPLPPATTGVSNLVHMKDLLGARVQGRDGAFGHVADIVFDRNGRLQYILATRNGQFFPLPFTPTGLSGTTKVLTYDVPLARLQELAIDPRQLPSLNNQAFVQRMQQVFGPTFGTGAMSAYPPGAATSAAAAAADARTGVSGSGAPVTSGAGMPGGRRPTGGSAVIDRDPGTGVQGTGIGGPGTSGSGTGRSGTGAADTGGIPGTGAGTSAAGKLQGAAAGGAPGSTGGTAGSAGGAPDRSMPPGAGSKGGSGTSAAGKTSGAANGGAPGSTGGTSRSGGGSTDSRGGNTTGGTTGSGTSGSGS
jgi:hypothetical protein